MGNYLMKYKKEKSRYVVSKYNVIHAPLMDSTICNGVGIFYEVPNDITIKESIHFCRKCFPYGKPKR